MIRQASLKRNGPWASYHNVTHVQAARMLIEDEHINLDDGKEYRVYTRDLGQSHAQFVHLATVEMNISVRPFRFDEEDE